MTESAIEVRGEGSSDLQMETLSKGLTVSMRSTISLRSSEYCLGIGLNSPLITRLYRLAMSFAWKGRCRAAISYVMHPSDQTSLLKSYGLSRQTSGEA